MPFNPNPFTKFQLKLVESVSEARSGNTCSSMFAPSGGPHFSRKNRVRTHTMAGEIANDQIPPEEWDWKLLDERLSGAFGFGLDLDEEEWEEDD